jgi:hypothetical protein
VGVDAHHCESHLSLVPCSQLKLDNNRLFGTLPAGLSALTALAELSLCNNSFSGEVTAPADVGYDTPSLCVFSSPLL